MKLNNKHLLNTITFLICALLSCNIAFAIAENEQTASSSNKVKVSKENKNKAKNKTETETVQLEYTNDIHSIFSLKDCVEIAIKYNPIIQASIYNEDVYKSKIGQAWSRYFPKISAGIDLSRTRNNYSPDIMSNWTTYNMGYLPKVSGEMLLFDFGRTKANADMSKRTYESKQEDTKENINTVICDIKSKYYNILFAQAQVKVYEDTVADYELQLKQAWGFYNLGKKAKIDVVTAEYNLGKAQLNLVKAKNILEVTRVQLSKTMGVPEYTNYELSGQMSLNTFDTPVEDLITKAFDVRPELISAKKKAEAAKLNLRAKRRDFAPELGIYASYGNGIGSEYNLSSAQLGVGLNYVALNILKVQKEIAEANASYKKSLADLEEVQDTVYLNVKKNYIDLQTAKEEIIIAKLALDQAKEQYRQVTGRYKAGIGDAIELKDGENTYLNARLDFYNVVLNYNIAVTCLEKEVGVPLAFSDKYIIDPNATY